MSNLIKDELLRFGIEDVSSIPLSLCRITKPYKLERLGMTDFSRLSAVIFTIPYYTEQPNKNISSYAVANDYHLFCKKLFDMIIPRLEGIYQGNRFAGFADDSPIDERLAAAMCGLGIMGQNGMLITEKHSSYVFLAEIITDLEISDKAQYEIKYCENCGKCSALCPKSDGIGCISALTQKKGELSFDEKETIKKYGSAWGCDICQEVCPHTALARERGTLPTSLAFFKNRLIPHLTSDMIKGMTDEDFSSRAYSWRKKETILRNLKILGE